MVTDHSWQQARLIPTAGVADTGAQARSATSVMLAVTAAVREFGRAVTQPLGAPAGPVTSFIDVPFPTAGDGRERRQDGLVRVRHEHDRQSWTALVQVRTGSVALDVARVEESLEVAHEQGFDVVLTISNELPGRAGRHPVTVDPARLRGVGLLHYSWCHLLAEAVNEQQHGRVAVADQAWMLGELIRYLRHPRSGVLEFDDGVDDPGTAPRPVTVLHSVRLPAPAPGTGTGTAPGPAPAPAGLPELLPPLPSRRDVRTVRRLEAGAGAGLATVQGDAGWYQDPHGSSKLRWWDGAAWTERTYPSQPALA